MDKKTLEAVLQQCGLSDEYARQEAVFLWPDVVGRLSAFAEASFVRDGVLHVIAASPSVAQELTLLATELLAKLNQRIRGEALHGIRIATGDVSRPERPLPQGAKVRVSDQDDALFAEVDDPQLRAAFTSVYERQRAHETALESSGGRRCPRCGVIYVGREPECPGCRYDAIEESSQAN